MLQCFDGWAIVIVEVIQDLRCAIRLQILGSFQEETCDHLDFLEHNAQARDVHMERLDRENADNMVHPLSERLVPTFCFKLFRIFMFIVFFFVFVFSFLNAWCQVRFS